MKKTLLIAALTIMSTSAFASKSRLGALQNAAQLSDVQDVLTKPDQAMALSEFATFEFGTSGSAATPATAEGGFTRKMDNSAYGLYFGNNGTSASGFRTLNSANFLGTEDALNLIYAMGMNDMTVGGGLYYSKSERKPDGTTALTIKSQDAMGLYVSAAAKAGWDAQFSLGLANNAKFNDTATTETKMTGKTTFKLSGGYNVDTMYVYAYYLNAGAKVENSTATTADYGKTEMKVGVINSHKKDGSNFFYGISYLNSVLKEDTSSGKIEASYLPFIVGLEAEATSWMTLRGSITQNVLIDNNKTSSPAGVASNDNGASDTTVAAGAGFKFGKMEFDGTLAAATTGATATTTKGQFGTDGASFLAQTSFTYMF